MKIFSAPDERFAGLDRKTLLFLLLAAAIVLATVVAALIRQDFFTQTTRLYVFTDSAQGIAKGMAVHFSGFRIGTVDDLSLEPNATVKVRLVINSHYTPFIRQDSEARLAKEGLIGASIIEIARGSPQMRPMANDGVLKFERAGDFADIARDLAQRIEPILDDIKSITESINNPEGDIRQTVKNARQATAQLAEAAGSVSAIARSGDARLGAIQERVDGVLERAGTALDTLAGSLATVDRRLPGLLLKLETTLNNFESTSAHARSLSSRLAEDVPPAMDDGRGLVRETREIVQGVRTAWPIRNIVPPAAEQALPLDSHDEPRPRR